MYKLYKIKEENYCNSRAIIKIIILLLILFGTFLYIITFSLITFNHILPNINIYTNLNNKNYLINDSIDVYNKYNNHKSYLVNTIGCKMPRLPIIDDNIRKYLTFIEPVKCGTQIFFSNHTHLWFDINNLSNNITDISLLKCYYEKLIRISDNQNKFSKYPKIFNINKFYKMTDEFVKVYCNYGDLESIYLDYHYFVQPMVQDDNKNNNNNNNNNHIDNQINVFIFGLDSLSRLNFHRQMNMTTTLLLNKLNGIELQGYNKVADNTYPNLIPVLTGLTDTELKYSCLKNSHDIYDKCNFIWNKYKLKNYKTIFTEDIGYLSLFNYLKSGFKHQPTDHYTRPIIIELEKNLANSRKYNLYKCLGNRQPIDIFMEHIDKILTTDHTRNQRKFGLFWSSSITHDDFNLPNDFDINIADFIENLYINNFLNDSILFLISDHGMRFGYFRNTYQGMVEERQPFLIAIIPEWFQQKYNLAIENFKKNIHRLTTHFDLYETLNDLTDLNNLQTDNVKIRTKELYESHPFQRGISLFLPIPLSRTCEMAGIEDHWCTCFEREKLSNKDIRVQNVAHFIVNELNNMLVSYPQCQKLYLNKITDASMEVLNKEILLTSNCKHLYDIKIQLQTKPGYGEFEATVRFDTKYENDFKLTGTISRINLYGKQSFCTDDYQMKLYCVCAR